MDLGHPGWKDKSGWRKSKKVGDLVLGPIGDSSGLGKVSKVLKEDSEDWVTASFEEDGRIMVGPSGNFYLLET